MRSEQEIKNQIDKLNSLWNNSFYIYHNKPNLGEESKKILELRFRTLMAEIQKLKWVLGYNYLSPQHSYRKENYENA
jgi:hypothetical protein